ncbi:MAG: PEP-CTERM sorting domain-containing protein [Alphaproteobacteria bacterium]|nr:PEP-CTERM sorting domain-containing protein [Alphaproteobacteria bacterium]
MNKTHAVLISAVVAGLALGAAIEHSGNPALAITMKRLVDAVKAPFALVAGRSPGERGAGALLSTKPGRPHERVLSGVRNREPVADVPPAADSSPLGVGPEGLGSGGTPEGIAPGGGAATPLSQYRGNTFPFMPFPIGFGTTTPGQPLGASPAPDTAGTGITAPAQLDNAATPPVFIPGTTGSGPLPEIPPTVVAIPPDAPNPGTTPGTPIPPATPIPEPSSWGMMLLGLLAIVFATVRRRRRDLSGIE